VNFRNKMIFYDEELLAPHPTPKLEDHPLSAVRDCLFNIFTPWPALVIFTEATFIQFLRMCVKHLEWILGRHCRRIKRFVVLCPIMDFQYSTCLLLLQPLSIYVRGLSEMLQACFSPVDDDLDHFGSHLASSLLKLSSVAIHIS
jgi:hypothetical protein